MPKRKVKRSKPVKIKIKRSTPKRRPLKKVKIKHSKSRVIKKKIKYYPKHVLKKKPLKKVKTFHKKLIKPKISKRRILIKEIKKPIVDETREILEEVKPEVEIKEETPSEEIKQPEEEKPKETVVSFPEKDVGIKYALIEPFAYADIKWDEKGKEFIYNLIEPQLTDEEKKIYEKIVSGLMEIIDIELSSVKKKEEALNYLEEQTKKVLEEYEIKLIKESFLKILYYIQRNFVGINEMEPLMQDPYIEDISCD